MKLLTLACLLAAGVVLASSEETNQDSKQHEKRGVLGLSYGGGFQHGGFDGDNHLRSSGSFGGKHGGGYETVTLTKKVPVSVPKPYPVEVVKHVPFKVLHPIPYTVKKPYPVLMKKPYPVYVEKPVPYTVEKKVPYPVHVSVKIPFPHPVPYTVEKKVPYPVHIPIKVPVPHPVTIYKKVPVFINSHGHE